MFFRCRGGPFDRCDYLPGDTLPEGGAVTLRYSGTAFLKPHWYGEYVREGNTLTWEDLPFVAEDL